MTLEGNNILVEELIDDINIGGITTRHDYDSPYMFCKVLLISDEAKEILGLLDETILVIKRYAKEEFIDHTFFVDAKDVRAIISDNTYKNILEEGLEWMRN